VTTTERWKSRSSIAAATVVSPRISPHPDGPIRSDHDRRLEVALVDDLEQRRCSLGRQLQIPQFVASR
jgi:hypothetical protein